MKCSEYNQRMIERFEDQIESGTLKIIEDNFIDQISLFKYFENLKNLIIRDCPRVQPILTSESITKLVLEYCQVRNTEQLNLPQLRELSLSNNDCQDIISLQFMQKLVKLNLSRNSLVDISVLTKLLNLTELDISNNYHIDSSPLKFMTQLIKLNASTTNIKSTALLRTLVNLKQLDLSKNIDCDISSLKYLINLIKLNLSDTCVQDISALEPLIHLQDLNVTNDFCANVFYVDITPLRNMKKLKTIISSYKQLQNTQIFNELTSLKKLDLSKQITRGVRLELLCTEIRNLNKLTELIIFPILKFSYYCYLQNSKYQYFYESIYEYQHICYLFNFHWKWCFHLCHIFILQLDNKLQRATSCMKNQDIILQRK
ncbi:leucine-rich_repeat domain-containing protein [Hexamita inflata]|uniref:Leucine-rich_repeat domain-containing protein n=1 Tax=Hexamita inflata TaxID=28002 RepID=A0ABP1I778_9EUKA